MKKKKLLLIGIPLLLIAGGGATVGLAMAGIIKVPFLPFGKKEKPAPKDDGKGGPFGKMISVAMAQAVKAQELADREAKAKAKAKPVASASKNTTEVDTEPGDAKLAAVWTELPTDQLVAITAKWPKESLGRILSKMDDEVTAKLIAAVPPDRGTAISEAVAAATVKMAAKVRESGKK